MKGNQKQILMFVGGLVLVLFVYHMLKGVCGCKLVEGIDEEIRCKALSNPDGGRAEQSNKSLCSNLSTNLESCKTINGNKKCSDCEKQRMGGKCTVNNKEDTETRCMPYYPPNGDPICVSPDNDTNDPVSGCSYEELSDNPDWNNLDMCYLGGKVVQQYTCFISAQDLDKNEEEQQCTNGPEVGQKSSEPGQLVTEFEELCSTYGLVGSGKIIGSSDSDNNRYLDCAAIWPDGSDWNSRYDNLGCEDFRTGSRKRGDGYCGEEGTNGFIAFEACPNACLEQYNRDPEFAINSINSAYNKRTSCADPDEADKTGCWFN